MSVPTGRLLHFCTRHLQRVPQHRAITTTCLRRNSGRNSQSQQFLGTAWEDQKLVKCLRAYDTNTMESGLVRGASVVSCLSYCAFSRKALTLLLMAVDMGRQSGPEAATASTHHVGPRRAKNSLHSQENWQRQNYCKIERDCCLVREVHICNWRSTQQNHHSILLQTTAIHLDNALLGRPNTHIRILPCVSAQLASSFTS